MNCFLCNTTFQVDQSVDQVGGSCTVNLQFVVEEGHEIRGRRRS